MITDIQILKEIEKELEKKIDKKNSADYNEMEDAYSINHENRITHLSLSGKNSDLIIKKIQKFTELKALSLTSMEIKDVSYINSFIKLEKLNLEHNNIVDVSAISKLTALIDLNISYNSKLDLNTVKELIQLKKLNLSYCNLIDISILKHLICIEELEIISNNITNLEPISHLNNLIELNVADNKITSIKPILKLKKLKVAWLVRNNIKDYYLLKSQKQLTNLSLGGNEISDITFLESLTNLKRLYLHDNNIKDISKLSKLTNLQQLNLNKNLIEDMSSLKLLDKLNELTLCNNPIKTLPKWIVNLPMNIQWDKHGMDKNTLTVYSETIKNPPIEIIKQGKEALIRYFDRIDKEGSETLHEVKLTLVGEGSAGKTSLINRLLKKNASLPKQNNRTRGIEIKDWNFKKSKNRTHIAHIWDFGGQDVYYPVHRFFITENSLFLLLASTRQTHHNFDYWVPTIYQFGSRSPIILGQTCHDGNKIAWNDLGIFLGNTNFNIIKTKEQPYFELNLPNKNEGLDLIKETIINQITNLPHYGREVPKSWAIVRNLLSQESKTSSCISFDKFKELCVNSNPESFQTSNDFIDCCRFLHNIGIVLWYSTNNELKNWVVLEPQWAMNAVYRIIDDQEIQSRRGNILKDDFSRLWDEDEYKEKHNVLKKMLEVFKIAFPKKHKKNDYIIPARLTSMPSNKKWDNDEPCLRLEYRYEFMPRGLVNQLSAELSRYIVSNTEVWNNAVNFLFMKDQAYCQVEENFYNRTLIVKSKGKEARSLIILVMDALQNIIEGYKGVNPEIYVPCICSHCIQFNNPETFLYEKLINWSERRKTVTCNESGENLSITDLLYKVGLKNPKKNQDDMIKEKNKKIFVSYSKFDEDYLQDFEDHLITLKDEGLITFNCREIKFGTEWDEEIKSEIDNCDIMVCLVSVKFLNTDYIKRVEITRAIENGKMIIPIIIKPCDWETSKIAKYQAAQRGKVVSLDNNKKLLGKIKESTEIERAAFWTGIIKEFRKKIF